MVARALRPPHRVLHTRQDWPPATVVLQIDLRSLLREWRSAECINTALLGACRDELPHASCVDKGHRTNCKTNAVRVAGLGRICFESSRWPSVVAWSWMNREQPKRTT